MLQVFWSGKLTPPMRLMIEANNVLTLFTGSYRDYSGMKERVRKGYEGEYSDHVFKYDERGYHLQDKSARYQLADIQFDGMKVLDVGCGTGALAHVALEKGSESVVCGDISNFMLKEAKRKQGENGYNTSFCQLDAENLPYKEGSFDAVITGMTFGTLPNQQKVVTEMLRVLKTGGLICIGAHGPKHYWEAIDATLRCINKRYVLGYRFEWWPRTEKYIRRMLEQARVENVRSKQVVWQNTFTSGAAAYDFFSAISSSWWYAKFPPEKREIDSNKTKKYFERKNIAIITDDIVVAYGYKPRNGA